MLEGQLELARGVFRDGAFQRHALRVRRRPQCAQEAGGVLDLAQAIDAVVVGPFAGGLRPGQLDAAGGGALGVDQIVLQLAGHHRDQAVGGEPVDDRAQHMARIEVVGRPVELVHRGEHLGDVVAQPGRRDQCAGRGLRHPVGVAVGPDQAGVLAVLPGDVADQDRARQEAAVLETAVISCRRSRLPRGTPDRAVKISSKNSIPGWASRKARASSGSAMGLDGKRVTLKCGGAALWSAQGQGAWSLRGSPGFPTLSTRAGRRIRLRLCDHFLAYWPELSSARRRRRRGMRRLRRAAYEWRSRTGLDRAVRLTAMEVQDEFSDPVCDHCCGSWV